MGNERVWDIAGFTNNLSQLGKRVPSGEILVGSGVKVSDDGASLVWPRAWPQPKLRALKPTPAMFSQFIELRDATAAEIRAFSGRWGRLYIQQDGSFMLGGIPYEEDAYREPIEAWHYFAWRAYSVLSIAASLTDNRPGDPQDWARLSSLRNRITDADLPYFRGGPFEFGIPIDRGFEPFAKLPIETQRVMLTVELNLWMKLGGLGLYLGLDESERGWQLELFFGGRLFAALALQLAMTVARAEVPHVCSACKYLYIRTKKDAKTGNNNYCDKCGKTEGLRQGDKRRREKIKRARDLSASGLNVSEITKQLNVRSAKTVRRWIEKGK